MHSLLKRLQILWLSLLLALAAPAWAECETPTADPQANRDACAILTWLHELPSLPERRVVSGQYGWKDMEAIRDLTGKWPALYEDFLWQKGASTWNRWPYAVPHRELMRDHWDKGGLVSIHMPIPNPKNKSQQHDTDMTDAEFREMLQEDSPINQNYREWLDMLAVHLAWLQQQGVTVFLRPLHEMNVGGFWYGNRIPEDYKRLFRYTVRYLTVTKRLHNLLIVFSPHWRQNGAVYYPGSDVVDVVGLDTYQDRPMDVPSQYEALSKLGKPFAITEVGWSGRELAEPGTKDARNDLLVPLKQALRRAVWWSSWKGTNSPATQLYCRELYQDRAVITREAVDWRTYLPRPARAAPVR